MTISVGGLADAWGLCGCIYGWERSDAPLELICAKAKVCHSEVSLPVWGPAFSFLTFIGSPNLILRHVFLKPTFFWACLSAESSRMDIANGHVRRSPSFMRQNFPTNHHYGGLSSQDPCSYFLKLSILVCHVASEFGCFMESMLGFEHIRLCVYL